MFLSSGHQLNDKPGDRLVGNVRLGLSSEAIGQAQ
jgi:hypothetical protein